MPLTRCIRMHLYLGVVYGRVAMVVYFGVRAGCTMVMGGMAGWAGVSGRAVVAKPTVIGDFSASLSQGEDGVSPSSCSSGTSHSDTQSGRALSNTHAMTRGRIKGGFQVGHEEKSTRL